MPTPLLAVKKDHAVLAKKQSKLGVESTLGWVQREENLLHGDKSELPKVEAKQPWQRLGR
jgi:hypothetical protein